MAIAVNQKSKGLRLKQQAEPSNYKLGDTWHYTIAEPRAIGPGINCFTPVLYVGTGTTNHIEGLGFQPDLVWIKNRDGSMNHCLYDSLREAGNVIYPDITAVEAYSSDGLSSFDSDGFTVKTIAGVNYNSHNFVAWCWLADQENINARYEDDCSSLTGWTDGDSGGSAVSTQETYDGEETFKLYTGPTTGSVYARREKTLGSTGSSSFVIELKFYPSVIGSNANSDSFQFLYQIDSSNRIFFNWGSDGFNVYNGSSYELFSSITPVIGSWNTWKLICDYQSSSNYKVSIYLNGELKGVTTNTAGNSAAGTSGRVQLTLSGYNTANILLYLDYIKIGDLEKYNADSGLSIVKYTGDDSVGRTVDHSLGKVPKFIIIKKLTGSVQEWVCYHTSLGADYGIWLSLSNAKEDRTAFFNDTEPTDTQFTLGDDGSINQSGEQHIAYLFSEIEGYSKFGSYTGNGSTSGNYVECGFEPVFIIVKRTNSAGNWAIIDNQRINGTIHNDIYANLNNSESGGVGIQFNSSGFVLTGSYTDTNASGNNYIFIAFGYNQAISGNDWTSNHFSIMQRTQNLGSDDGFKTVLYDGNSSTNAITSLGLQPDMVWIKQRNAAGSHELYDSVRGTNKRLIPDLNNAENTETTALMSFDSDGFTLGAHGGSNATGGTFVAWCWRCPNDAYDPTHNGEKYNQETGVSIIKYTGNSINGREIRHSLDKVPKFMIIKRLDSTGYWYVYHSQIPYQYKLYLNYTYTQALDNTVFKELPTSSTFTVGSDSAVNNNNSDFIAYLFSEIDGYSSFGSYTGNGSSNGPVINCGFEPAFVMIKRTSTAQSWIILDNTRDTTNPRENYLFADTSDTESTGVEIDFLSNGFQPRGSYSTMNSTGEDYIYIAFADEYSEGPKWKELMKPSGAGANYGYSAGGSTGSGNISTIERITFPFNSGTASNVGNLSGTKQLSSGCNSSIYSFSLGGHTGSNIISIIDRITFPHDSGNAVQVGNLSSSRYYAAGYNSSTHGYTIGGSSSVGGSSIDRIRFPHDSGNAVQVGNLSTSRTSVMGGFNSSIHGFINGGNDGSYLTSIDRIIFSHDSGTATNVGNTTSTKGSTACCNSSLHGFMMGGANGSGGTHSSIERMLFPHNSGTATNVGNLSGTRLYSSGYNSSIHGFNLCGGSGANRLSIIDRITFPHNSGISVYVGNLSTSLNGVSCTDGVDFVSQFI